MDGARFYHSLPVATVDAAKIIVREFFYSAIQHAPQATAGDNTKVGGWPNYETIGDIQISAESAWAVPNEKMLNLEEFEQVIDGFKKELFYKYSYYFKFAIKQTDDIYYGFYMIGQIKKIIKFEKDQETLCTTETGNIIANSLDGLRNSISYNTTNIAGNVQILAPAHPHATNSNIFKSFPYKDLGVSSIRSLDPYIGVPEFGVNIAGGNPPNWISDNNDFDGAGAGITSQIIAKHALSGYACLLKCTQIVKENYIINTGTAAAAVNVPIANLNIKDFINLIHNQCVTLTSFKSDRSYNYHTRNYINYAGAGANIGAAAQFSLADRLVQALLVLKNPPIDKYTGSINYKEYEENGNEHIRGPITLAD
jgi:hypothetical protein